MAEFKLVDDELFDQFIDLPQAIDDSRDKYCPDCPDTPMILAGNEYQCPMWDRFALALRTSSRLIMTTVRAARFASRLAAAVVDITPTVATIPRRNKGGYSNS